MFYPNNKIWAVITIRYIPFQPHILQMMFLVLVISLFIFPLTFFRDFFLSDFQACRSGMHITQR